MDQTGGPSGALQHRDRIQICRGLAEGFASLGPGARRTNATSTATKKIMTTRRLYYDDSFLREFDAQVVSCEPAANRDGRPAYEILLDSTAFYPTSGGQPHDSGRLDDAEVLDVRDDGEEIVHVVDRGF